MAKYFDDERNLPFKPVTVRNDVFNQQWLERKLSSSRGKISLCYTFQGFDETCLGYVVNIQNSEDRFIITDITGKQLLNIDHISDVVAMVRHVSGTQYYQIWQTEFQRLRNEITSH
jgi:hypothetical protein